MKLILFTLSMVAVVWMTDGCLSCYKPEPECPTTACKTALNDDQIGQVEASAASIRRWEQEPDLIYSDKYDPVVTLTAEQESQLLLQYPGLFQTRLQVNLSDTTAGHKGRRSVSAIGRTRICQPQPSSQPLVLARRPNGDVVQLAQIAGRNQWIIEETCLSGTDDVAGNSVTCELAERSIPALFINLSGILNTGGENTDFDMAYIVIHHCVSTRL